MKHKIIYITLHNLIDHSLKWHKHFRVKLKNLNMHVHVYSSYKKPTSTIVDSLRFFEKEIHDDGFSYTKLWHRIVHQPAYWSYVHCVCEFYSFIARATRVMHMFWRQACGVNVCIRIAYKRLFAANLW